MEVNKDLQNREQFMEKNENNLKSPVFCPKAQKVGPLVVGSTLLVRKSDIDTFPSSEGYRNKRTYMGKNYLKIYFVYNIARDGKRCNDIEQNIFHLFMFS